MALPDHTSSSDTSSGTDRRSVLRSAGIVGGAAVVTAALAACGSSNSSNPAGSSAAGPASSAAAGGGGATASVAKSKVPVGSGIIDDSLQTVITQPTSGEFKAFNYLCTHQQCPVSQIQGAKILCACHGSEFSVKDGSVLQGPATAPLAPKTATPKGSRVIIS